MQNITGGNHKQEFVQQRDPLAECALIIKQRARHVFFFSKKGEIFFFLPTYTLIKINLFPITNYAAQVLVCYERGMFINFQR